MVFTAKYIPNVTPAPPPPGPGDILLINSAPGDRLLIDSSGDVVLIN